MRGHGDRIALVTSHEEITYAEALEQIDHIAGHFRAAGIAVGNHVGIAMQDSAEALLAVLACWRLSATAVVLDFRAPRSLRASLARDFNLAIVFESAFVPGEGEYPNAVFDGRWRFTDARGPTLPPAGDDSHPAFLLFTSGTTGAPKAYIQTHDVLAARISTRAMLLDSREMRFLTPMALTYSATRHQVFAYLLLGGTVRLFPPLFTPSELAEALLAFQASGTALPPPVITRLAREAGPRSAPLFPDLSVLASVGGPARPDDKVAAYRNLSPGYRMGYASSLTGMIAVLAGPDVLMKPETTGRAAGSARIEILDEAGSVLPVGQIGRIKAWTPSIVPAIVTPGGHVGVDPETMGAGWGIPGDLGYLDGDGFLTIVDRQADVIVRGGVNVAPQELEKLIARHPRVVEVAVVGFPDDTLGQEIAAFIVSDGAALDEFATFMRENITPDHRPRKIRLVPSLPYNEHGKLLRRELADRMRHSSVADKIE
jgi:long-chain acyl-CoA synthetase